MYNSRSYVNNLPYESDILFRDALDSYARGTCSYEMLISCYLRIAIITAATCDHHPLIDFGTRGTGASEALKTRDADLKLVKTGHKQSDTETFTSSCSSHDSSVVPRASTIAEQIASSLPDDIKIQVLKLLLQHESDLCPKYDSDALRPVVSGLNKLLTVTDLYCDEDNTVIDKTMLKIADQLTSSMFRLEDTGDFINPSRSFHLKVPSYTLVHKDFKHYMVDFPTKHTMEKFIDQNDFAITTYAEFISPSLDRHAALRLYVVFSDTNKLRATSEDVFQFLASHVNQLRTNLLEQYNGIEELIIHIDDTFTLSRKPTTRDELYLPPLFSRQVTRSLSILTTVHNTNFIQVHATNITKYENRVTRLKGLQHPIYDIDGFAVRMTDNKPVNFNRVVSDLLHIGYKSDESVLHRSLPYNVYNVSDALKSVL